MEQQNTTNRNDNNTDAQLDEYTELVTEALQQGTSLKDLEGIPAELMDGVYRFAYDFYQQGKLEEAETFFRFLCLYDFNNSDYIMGLGAVKQLQNSMKQRLISTRWLIYMGIMTTARCSTVDNVILLSVKRES